MATAYGGVRLPKPRALGQPGFGSPVPRGPASVVNLAPNPGPRVTNATDPIADLVNGITSSIAAQKAAANVDVADMLKNIKATQANWKPPVINLPPVAFRVTPGRASTGGIASGVKLSGGVDQWIAQAYKILGVPLTAQALANERYLINKESSGNPNAVNNWDINAKRGDPSIGIEQTTGSTFRRYMLPGHGNIRNPVDNILASLRYRLGRYHKYDIGRYSGGY
jgi:Transglycosylase SLT domain